MNTKAHQEPLVGKDVRVLKARNSALEGIAGIVEDETKHTLVVGGKRVIKRDIITLAVDTTAIDGKTIDRIPSERIKVHKQ
jgi:RNase P/RNase MRP subunit p29